VLANEVTWMMSRHIEVIISKTKPFTAQHVVAGVLARHALL